MIQDNSVPSEWWGEASAMASIVPNRTPVSTLHFVAPLNPLLLPSIPPFYFSSQNHQNLAKKPKNILSVPGEVYSGNISENPKVTPIHDATSPSHDFKPSIPLGGDCGTPLPEKPGSDSPVTSTLAKDNNHLQNGESMIL
ncbi:hypothetical protein O181_091406 [Austropuccinia psidii MF-1]|uniref:Uncharacterized protein n=1 Tax=Austropuccinia psidii MF-1 TaxID=1389203 RepID=A0A9Q3P9M7_9BASI|nr:hypothetical protein [Austropuccinia psidii MF-1]